MEQPTPSPDAVRAQLDKVLASAAFRGGNRSSALLRFVVTAALEGRSQYIKEYTLGTEVLGRGDTFDALHAVALEGTNGAVGPFFSPDGQWVGYWADGRLSKTLAVGAGSPIVLAEAPDFLGASWGNDGYIVARLDRTEALWRIPDTGGTPIAVSLDAERATLRWPQLLPDGRTVLGTVSRANGFAIAAVRLDGRGGRTLLPAGSFARYVASGHLVYLDRGALFAVPFDAERLETRGVPVRVLEDIAHDPQFGFAQVAVSDNGALVYLRSTASGLSTIRWLDGGLASRPLLAESARYQWPRLSPDGRYLAYALLEGSNPDIWTLDLATGAKTRITDAGSQLSPVWSPDSRYLIYTDATKSGLYSQRADGAGGATLLVEGLSSAWSFSPDGTRLAHHRWNDATSFDIAALIVEPTSDGLRAGPTETLLATRAFENYPAISPDGRWLAYCSNESGSWEVYVAAYPNGTRSQVSPNGGCIPAWAPDSPLLFYETIDQRLMAVAYRIEDDAFVPGGARVWSSVPLANTGVISNYDVSAGGVVALVAAVEEQLPGDHVTLVTSFFDELQARVPPP